ncbi:isoleucine--tRNA ligase [Candidatus Woesearchaeota archaeon]|nr:isoleucine--tRNA ligase [Candidatus Woesearchaeota archaeon]
MVGNYNFKEIEPEMLRFWDENKIYQKIKDRNKGKKKFNYLDGPPYTSGRIHLGHAWGKALRDAAMRYKRMQGFDVWDRAGFDMHGLPTENKVCAKFNFTHKDQIEEFGVEKFNEECRKFCIENMELMIKDFHRIGVWMDFDNPYRPITPEFIAGEWFLVKRAFEQDRLYEGHKVMTWCRDCATSLSKHELEYKEVTDTSIFVKFKVKGKDNEHLVIWTTTPWTIPFNLAVMVNPDLDYVRIKTEGETWILAKAILGPFMGSVAGKDFEIVEEFKGETLEGIHYEHIFHNESDVYEKIAKKFPKAFSVLMSTEYVDTTAGSGLVHCAPGCGPEDYEVGRQNGLEAFNEIDEYGVFSDVMKKFAGLTAKKDDKLFIQHIENTGQLIAKTPVEHDYAHCWRCKQPVVFRATEQWFFKVEDLKDKMVEFNKDIKWVPEAAFNAFESWLKNIKDNGITRQRYWGTPAPIWQCTSKKCKHIEVIGSIDELKSKTEYVPEDLHKPFIDQVMWKCEKCKHEMKRVPDVLDVWIDAGCASWLCYDYPQQKDLFEKWFPADLILEGKDQIRGWFNLLMVASVLAFDKPSFKNVYMNGFINDYRGMKMSKSLGNVTSPYEVIDEFGADTLRYYCIGAARAGQDMNYNPEDTKVRLRNLLILWNMHNLLIDTVENTGIKPGIPDQKKMGIEEAYIISRLQTTIKDVTQMFDAFRLDEIPDEIESFYLDLSRNYIQYVRDKLALGTDEEKQMVVDIISYSMIQTLTMFAPIAPFVTEQMYQNLKGPLGMSDESIHMMGWPDLEASYINKDLEYHMDLGSKIIQTVLRAREKAQIGVRWPVSEILIESLEWKEVIDDIGDLIKNQVNCKKISIIEKFDKVEFSVGPNFKLLGKDFGQNTAKVAEALKEIDANELVDTLNKEGSAVLQIGDEEFTINKDHVEIGKTVPKGFEVEDLKEVSIYLNTERTEELLAEGFAREVMRRIQSARKDAGLKRSDAIDLELVTDDAELHRYIEMWKGAISQKVGAKSCKVHRSSEHKAKTAEKIKGKKLGISF